MAFAERYALANQILIEHREAISEFVIPRDISAILRDPSRQPLLIASPEEALTNRSKYILIQGRKDVKEQWLQVLPYLSGLEEAILNTTAISQNLLAAVCSHNSLRRLCFQDTRLESLDVLVSAHKLTHLFIGSSPRVPSLDPLSRLSGLIALGIHGNFPRIRDLASISSLRELRGLEVCGQDYKDLKLDSLDGINSLQSLEYLNFAGVRVAHGGLSAVAQLPHLEYLSLDPHHLHVWTKADFQLLHEAKPHLRGTVVERAATDANFQRTMGIK